METTLLELIPPFCFLILVTLILWLIFWAQYNPHPSPKSPPQSWPKVTRIKDSAAMNILQWEFDYIKTTASEAMRDRHTMINYYLLAVGIVVSGVAALLTKESGFPPAIGTALLWVLCMVGLFYFLKIIRLRQAWHESAKAMNRIKKIFILNIEEKDFLEDAFMWDVESLPLPNKRWNVFHYSAMLIGFLNSMAFIAGSILTSLKDSRTETLADLSLSSWQWIVLTVFGLYLFFLHDYMYNRFLK